MLQKPSTCWGCPMYGSGKGFVPDTLVPNTRLTIVAQNPGKDEERGQRILGYDGKQPIYEACVPQPLVGATGFMLRDTYLPLTGCSDTETSFCNILKCRLKGTNDLPTGDELKAAVAHCVNAHLRIPESTELIVAMGGPAFEALCPDLAKRHRATRKGPDDEKGGPITTWRGFVAPDTYQGKKVFAVVHLADLFRDAGQRLPARLDWRRCGHYLRQHWPERLPQAGRLAADVSKVHEAFDQAEQAAWVVCDTEFDRYSKFLTLIGLCWEINGQVAGVQLEWVNNPDVTSEVRAAFVRRLARLTKTTRFVFQNAKADLAVIEKNLHIPWRISYAKGYDDTMHMHSVLWSELPHSLEFLASIYGKHDKLKHLSETDMLLYNWGDVIETHNVYKALKEEFQHDPKTERIYLHQSLPLIPITLEREQLGIRVNQRRLPGLLAAYEQKVQSFELMAQAYAGYPINLMSSGKTGQLATHLRVYEGVTLKTVREEAISEARDKFLPFDRELEDKQGFSVEYLEQRMEDGAQPLLELRAAIVHYKGVLNQDLVPLKGKLKVYPSFRHDAQASGRWSTTKPALAKVPNDLLDLYLPAEGHILFGADYDAQEPRIFMAEAKSAYLKKSFDEKLDIHTMLVCDMFGWPLPPNLQNPHSSPESAAWRDQVGWSGKEDKRRTVSKNVRYERYYLGTGMNAVKKAVKLGLPKQAMMKASELVLSQDPNVAEFHRQIKKAAKGRRIRSWAGRLRVLMHTGEKAEREACNHVMQAGGVDILNETVIEVCQTWSYVRLFYTRHDSFFFEIPTAMFTPELAQSIRAMAERPRMINGQSVPFPCSWKLMHDDGRIEGYKYETAAA